MTTEITDANFDQITKDSKKPFVIDFSASWCGPCRMLSPIMDELALQFKDEVTICKADVDTAVALAAKFGIKSIPAVFFLKANLEEVDKFVGVLPKPAIIEKIEKLKIA